MFNKCVYDGKRFGAPLAEISDYLWRVPLTLAEGLRIRAAEILLDSTGWILAWKWLEDGEWKTCIFSEVVSTIKIRLETDEDYIGHCYVVVLNQEYQTWDVRYTLGSEFLGGYESLSEAVKSLPSGMFERYKVPVEGYR